MTVTMKEIPNIISALKKRKPLTLSKDSDRPLSPKEAVRQLAPVLLQKKEEGFTTVELVDVLAEQGIAVKAHNLARYLREHGSPTAKPQAKPKQPSPQSDAFIVEPESHKTSLPPNDPQQ
jgi:transposase